MLSRFLIGVQDHGEQAVTWAKSLDKDDVGGVIRRLAEVGKTHGGFGKPDAAAYKWFDSWYQKHSKTWKSGDIADERMAPYFSRKHDHLLRLTAALTLAAGEPHKYTVKKFNEALAMLEWLEADVPKAYAQMALSPIAAAQQHMVTVLRRNQGMMEHSRLQKRCYRHLPLKEQFKAVLESLIDMGVIRAMRSSVGRGVSYSLVKELD
jgi:hypothetical protein